MCKILPFFRVLSAVMSFPSKGQALLHGTGCQFSPIPAPATSQGFLPLALSLGRLISCADLTRGLLPSLPMLADPSAASWVPWLPASSCGTLPVTGVTAQLPHACPPWGAPTLLLLLVSCPATLPGSSQVLDISAAKSFSSVL